MNCGTISKLLAPDECKPRIASLIYSVGSKTPVDGCTLSIDELMRTTNVFFKDSDLVIENGRPVRTKRSYGKNKRPSPIIKFVYGDHSNK